MRPSGKAERELAPDPAAGARVQVLRMILLAVGAVLAVRLVVLQVVQHEQWTAVSRDYRMRKEVVEPRRGMILDRSGEILVRDQTVFDLCADPYHLKDPNLALAGLSRGLGEDATFLRRLYSAKELAERYRKHAAGVVGDLLGGNTVAAETIRNLGDGGPVVVLAHGLELADRDRIEAGLEAAAVRGIYFRDREQRLYPNGTNLGHVLGYLDGSGAGVEGVEGTMDRALRGTAGVRWIERDSRGREIAAFRQERVVSGDGHSVRLTIDMGLQEIVEDLLDEAMARFRPEKLSVILQDPRDGSILALANRPSFDPATRTGSSRNVAVSDQYEPGSTFKIVAAGAVLDSGVADPETEVFCHFGELSEPGVWVRDTGQYGNLTLAGVMAKSSNVGIYKVVRRLPPEQFHRYIGYFGFGEKTGIHLTAEAAGAIRPPEKWTVTSMSRLAMGYEVSVTALQMVNAMSAVANGGELLRPRVVDALLGTDGAVIKAHGRESVRRVMSPQAAGALAEMLTGAVGPEGSGRRAAVPGYQVAGKTGTAQRYAEEAGGYVEGSVVASFAGFLPVTRPRLTGIVVIHDPQVEPAERFGGALAAPVFAEIARRAVAYLDIPPDGTEEVPPPRAPGPEGTAWN